MNQGKISPAHSEKSSAHESFLSSLETKSEETGSRIVLALDLEHRKNPQGLLDDAKNLVEATSEYICGVKINFHLIVPLSLREMIELNDFAKERGLPSIADIKLNDIDNTNLTATRYLWDSGFSAVIVNPFAGFKGGLDSVYETAHELGKGVISLAFMSHPGAEEGYGLELADGRTMFDLMLERAIQWGSDGVILGATRPEKISYARKKLSSEIKILCPGSGSQGGDPEEALKAGADYLIFGRTIVASQNPKESAKELCLRLSYLPRKS